MRKRLLKSPFMQTVLSTVATAYLRFVGLTSKKIFFRKNLFQTLDENWPAIIAVWHGEHFSISTCTANRTISLKFLFHATAMAS